MHRVVASHLALREFDKTTLIGGPRYGEVPIKLQNYSPIDFSLRPENRILRYSQNLNTKKGLPLAVLSFEKLHLRVPVFEGTDNWTLNRGAGWIAGTARPGEKGNIGIAAHRDSFFRVLKDTRKGDAMELVSATGTAVYIVDQVEIVGPEDVAVLQPRLAPSLTLITCYPFYFVGKAPQRFIVHAALSKQQEIEKFWK